MQKNALQIAGEQITEIYVEQSEVTGNEALMLIGRSQGISFGYALMGAADAAFLKYLKDRKVHKVLGLTWQKFCSMHLKMDQKTADNIVSLYETHRDRLFEIANIVGISPRRLATVIDDPRMQDDGWVTDSGKKLLYRSDVARIRAEIALVIKERKEAQTAAERAEAELQKAFAERDNARKAAEKVRQEMKDRDRKAELAWEGAGEDQRFLLNLEIERDFLLQKLRSFSGRELSPEDQDRLIGFCEATWSEIHQVTEKIRGMYGVGLLTPHPSTSIEVDELTPNKRSLQDEYHLARPLKAPAKKETK